MRWSRKVMHACMCVCARVHACVHAIVCSWARISIQTHAHGRQQKKRGTTRLQPLGACCGWLGPRVLEADPQLLHTCMPKLALRLSVLYTENTFYSEDTAPGHLHCLMPVPSFSTPAQM
jgi:hypothetical protein